MQHTLESVSSVRRIAVCWDLLDLIGVLSSLSTYALQVLPGHDAGGDVEPAEARLCCWGFFVGSEEADTKRVLGTPPFSPHPCVSGLLVPWHIDLAEAPNRCDFVPTFDFSDWPEFFRTRPPTTHRHLRTCLTVSHLKSFQNVQGLGVPFSTRRR